MQRRFSVGVAVGLLVGTFGFAIDGFAKNKDKPLPEYILSAHTVAVMIDPMSGASADDPQANRIAQRDVESALVSWGRYVPMASPKEADLIIVIRRVRPRVADDAISDSSQNSRTGPIGGAGNGPINGPMGGANNGVGGVPNGGMGTGAQRGGTGSGFPDSGIHQPVQSQVEMGPVDDSFTVYKGKQVDPLDTPAGFRYVARDGLRSRGVPAVEEFKKAVAAADKAAAAAKSQ